MPLFVGIGGPSGAGKTTLARALVDLLPQHAAILPLDWYYVDLAGVGVDQRRERNFDHPDALDWERFFDDFMQLESGSLVHAPQYDFALHTRAPHTAQVEPRPVILIEGLHSLWQPALRSMLNYKIYVDASQSICLKRRIDRDTHERGRSAGDVIKQFKQHTNPMFLEFVQPTKGYADVVVSGEEDITAAAARIATQLWP
jgi:uridine kinase